MRGISWSAYDLLDGQGLGSVQLHSHLSTTEHEGGTVGAMAPTVL